VSRFTKARPTVGAIPRDSLTAHIICCDSMPIVDTAVRGRVVLDRPFDCLACHWRESVVVAYSYDVVGACETLFDRDVFVVLGAVVPNIEGGR